MSILGQLAHKFGYELKKHYKITTPTASASLVNVINHYGIDMVLDVGANVGQFGLEIRKEGYAGHIHSFEPVKSTFRQLEEVSSKDEKWQVHNYALGSSAGEREIYVMGSSDLCSFHNPSDFGKKRYKRLEVSSKENVSVSTVTEFIKNHGLTGKELLLKMDTQGHDLEVLAGATDVMSQVIAIQSEISFKSLYFDVPNHIQSLSVFDDLGYAVADLHTINKSEDLSMIEMDCLLVRKK